MSAPFPDDVAGWRAALARAEYHCGDTIALAVHLGAQMAKPLLIEGPPGVGKTDLARAVAQALNRPLERLQCYEGLDESRALYEWKYAKQLLYAQVMRDSLAKGLTGDGKDDLRSAFARLREVDDEFFSRDFLEPRPVLRALLAPRGAVLLIDEIDKAEQDIEALLLEVLERYEIHIPEIGAIQAQVAPFVVLTSNASRELGDALRRRCLHVPMTHPAPAIERKIVETRAPGVGKALAAQLVAFVGKVREMNLRRPPSVAETVDWARALALLGGAEVRLDAASARASLPALLKRTEDAAEVARGLDGLLRATR